MTASKLGKTVHVSESTVVRFASELKYDGYPAMQKALQEMIRNKLTSIQRIEVSNDIIGNADVVSSVMQSDMEKIRMTMEEIDRDSFDKAADAIVEAAKKGPFLSKDDFRERSKASKTIVELLDTLGILGDLPESNQISLFDFMVG